MENNETAQNETFHDSAYFPKPDYLRSINQAVIITNLNGIINFWNKAATEIYGWTVHEAVGKSIIDLVPTQQTKEQAIEIMNLLLQGQSWSGEFIVQRKNGESFPAFVIDLPYYSDQNKLSGVIGISTDLTEEKRSEREIRLLLNNTEESFILLDTQLNILAFNKQAYDLYKKHMGGALTNDLSILQFAHPSRIEALKKDYHQILAGNIHESEITFTDKEGIKNTFALKYTPAKDESNKIVGISFSAREITEQKKAEAALIANEAKWHAMVENIHDIFMILDKDGQVKYVSPAITKVLKYEEQEIMYNNLVDLFHSDDEDTIKEILVNSFINPGTQLQTGRTRIKNKRGEWIWVEGNIINLLANKEISGIVYTSWEVTDLVKGEVILKQEQKNKEALINATNDLIWSINENYELIAANAAFVKTLKLSTGIYVEPGDSLMRKDKFKEDYLTFWRSLYSKAFTGESFHQEIYTANTSYVNDAAWVEVSFNPILQNNKVTGIACLSRNITERKRQEEKDKELAVNQSLFSAIVNSSQDAIISKTLDGIITSWNKAAENIFGYTAAEIIGKSITTIIPPELVEEEAYIINQIKAKQPIQHFETVRIDKFGNRKIVSLSVSPILNNEGNVVEASKISRDITSQKQDAIALQQNQARLQGIIASQTNYVIRTDLKGNYSYYNDTFFKDFGWVHKDQSLIGVSVLASIMPYHHDVVKNTVEKCFAEPNKVFQVEIDKPLLNGDIKTTFWDFICLTDLQGNPVEIQCVGIDITDRVSTENLLKQSLEERDSILESIGDGFFAVDKNWITTYWNANAESMLGIPREKIIGTNIWGKFPEQISIASYENFKAVLENKELRQYESYNLTSDQWYEVNVYPSQMGLSVYFRDVTKKKKSDDLIIEANKRFNLVARASSDVIWDWNIDSGTLFLSAENIKKVFGWDQYQEDKTFEFWHSKIHRDDIDRVNKKVEDTFKDIDESFLACEYRFEKADGTYAHVYDKGYIIRDAAGKPTRVIGAIQDITRLKENELQLKTKAEELANSNKELEQFAFVASHDLQEPLRMVTTFLTQLKKNYEASLDERANDYIKFAVDGAVRMRQIILDLLEYSRVGRINQPIEQVNTSEVIKEIMLLTQKTIEELNAKIDFTNLPIIHTHRSPLRQLLQNLIMNALKFTKVGVPPKIEITALDETTQWKFAVKDHGIGIEKEYFDKIFIIFQRLHIREEYAGSGIGLSIAKKIVETMGGNIWVESTPGQGTTFFFTIKKI